MAKVVQPTRLIAFKAVSDRLTIEYKADGSLIVLWDGEVPQSIPFHNLQELRTYKLRLAQALDYLEKGIEEKVKEDMQPQELRDNPANNWLDNMILRIQSLNK